MLQAQNSHNSVANCLIALGSNLPSPTGSVPETVSFAFELLGQCESFQVVSRSRFYKTPAYPPGSGPEFVNAAVCIATTASPSEILAQLHRIEAELGRVRNTRWEARVLDLDLLAIESLILPDTAELDRWMNLSESDQMGQAPDQLILPHPRMQDRGFVLVPLADIAPDWVHPRLKLSVREMLARLPAADLAGISPI